MRSDPDSEGSQGKQDEELSEHVFAIVRRTGVRVKSCPGPPSGRAGAAFLRGYFVQGFAFVLFWPFLHFGGFAGFLLPPPELLLPDEPPPLEA